MSRRVDGGDLGPTRDPGNPRRMGLILAAAVGLALLGGIAFFVAASSRDRAPVASSVLTPTATLPAAVTVVSGTPSPVAAQVVTAAASPPPPTEVPMTPTAVVAVLVATPPPPAPTAPPSAAPLPPAPAPAAPAGAGPPPPPPAPPPPAAPQPTSPPTAAPPAPPAVAKAPIPTAALPTAPPTLAPKPGNGATTQPGGGGAARPPAAAGQGGVVVEAGREAVLRCPNGVVLTVRRETLRETVTLNCGPIDPATVPPTPGRRLGDLIFEVIADDGRLAELPSEINLGVDYGDEDLAGLNEQQLVLGFLDNGRWTTAPKLATDPANNFVSASVTRLGVYAVYSR